MFIWGEDACAAPRIDPIGLIHSVDLGKVRALSCALDGVAGVDLLKPIRVSVYVLMYYDPPLILRRAPGLSDRCSFLRSESMF